MIILDSTKKLQIVLSGAVTTSELQLTAAWLDTDTSGLFSPGDTTSATNSTTAVDLIPAPAASTFRQVKSTTVFNSDTVAAIVSVIINHSTTQRMVAKINLPVGYFIWIEGDELAVFDTNGARVTSIATGAPSGPAGGDLGGAYPDPTVEHVDAAKIDSGILDEARLLVVQTVGDADTVISDSTREVQLGAALTTNRTFTLPAASSKSNGESIVITDAVGGIRQYAAAYGTDRRAIIAPAGADTVNGGGGFRMGQPYMQAIARSDGVSKWSLGVIPSTEVFENNVTGAIAGAYGAGNTVSGDYACAVGYRNTASGYASFVGGSNSTASNTYSFAIGGKSNSSGVGSFALGSYSKATADSSLACGQYASAYATQSAAIGYGAKVKSTANNAMALGSGAYASVANATAVGKGALGDISNAVSVGATGTERKIVHLANGTNPTDAAAFGQIPTALTPVGTALSSAKIWVGNGSNVAAAVSVSGDVTLSNAGVVAVTKINGVALGTTTATSGNLLIASGTTWGTQALSGDATISNTGVLTLANTAVTGGSYVAASITVDGKGRLTAAATWAPNVQAVSSSATVTPTFSNDLVKITAQAAALSLANPTGSAVPGWAMVIRIKDNGTARAITFDTQYRAIGITLPTTTVISKTMYLGMIYNSDDTKWDVVSVAQQA